MKRPIRVAELLIGVFAIVALISFAQILNTTVLNKSDKNVATTLNPFLPTQTQTYFGNTYSGNTYTGNTYNSGNTYTGTTYIQKPTNGLIATSTTETKSTLTTTSSTIPTCTDSDYGRNHFLYGSVSSGGLTSYDSCYTANTLMENYCSTTTSVRQVEYVNCPAGCSNGACIGTCYTQLDFTEKQLSTTSVQFTLNKITATPEKLSHLVRTFSTEEPSEYRLSFYNSVNKLVREYELRSSRFINYESFDDPENSKVVILNETVDNVFIPLDQYVRLARYLKISAGIASTTKEIYTSFNPNIAVCSVGTDTSIDQTSLLFGKGASGILSFSLSNLFLNLPPAPTVKVNISKIGPTGSGTVSSSPAGIICGSSCSYDFPLGTVVSLSALPSQGYLFKGWTGGGCSGTGTCAINLDTDQTIINTTATFDVTPPLTMITGGGINAVLRNNYNGWVGLRFKVGSSNIVVTDLGRYFMFGGSTHTVVLLDENTSRIGSVSVPSNGISGDYVYGKLSTPITLLANKYYYLFSAETPGGDYWYNFNNWPLYDFNTVKLANKFSSVEAVYTPDLYAYWWQYIFPTGGANTVYGPLNLIFK